MRPLVIGREAIAEALAGIDLVAMSERAFAAYSAGRAQVSAVGELLFDDPPGEAHVKAGRIEREPIFVVKVATGFYANPERGLPSSSGLVVAFDAATGEPRAVLLDEGLLTDERTAAAGAAASRLLAPPEAERIGILGAGIQARRQLAHHRAAMGCRRASLWARRADQAEDLAKEAAGLGFEAEIAATPAEVADACRLIVTTTPSKEPLLFAADVRPGTHITAVGSDTPEKGELASDLLARADGLFADSRTQARERGELRRAPAGAAIVELGEIIEGRAAGRPSADAITIADLTGIATQDAAVAGEALKALEARAAA